MNFGKALDQLKNGERVARSGWNGTGMWLILVPASNPTIKPDTPYGKVLGEYAATDGLVEQVSIEAHIDMFTAQGNMQPGWLASQADMLADDWGVL